MQAAVVWRRDHPSEVRLMDRCKAEIEKVVPGSVSVLFGSCARGDARQDSDWDLLIRIPGTLSETLRDRINDVLLEIEMEENVIISSLVVEEDPPAQGHTSS